jgi:EAL domain-containing protein (putative c-di-GMP-specific phosphodiesterase class I)
VDSVKIDGSFVRGLAGSRENQHFVRTLVSLAKSLELSTVAEWVSCEEERVLLRDMGVDYLQGYYFGAPTLNPDWKVD